MGQCLKYWQLATFIIQTLLIILYVRLVWYFEETTRTKIPVVRLNKADMKDTKMYGNYIWSSLQYRCILGMQVHIFILGCHLGFGNCAGLGQRNICRGKRHEVKTMGEGKEKCYITSSAPPLTPHPASAPSLYRPSIQLRVQSKMATSKAWFIKPSALR